MCPGVYHLIWVELLLVAIRLHRHRNAVIAALGAAGARSLFE